MTAWSYHRSSTPITAENLAPFEGINRGEPVEQTPALWDIEFPSVRQAVEWAVRWGIEDQVSMPPSGYQRYVSDPVTVTYYERRV